MKKLVLSLFTTISFSVFAQTHFVNCNDSKPISNLMVFDSNQNYIGITNEAGLLEKEITAAELIINHPNYGNQRVTLLDKQKVCLDYFNDELADKKNGSRSCHSCVWQARRESNPQHPVLETGALPIELLA